MKKRIKYVVAALFAPLLIYATADYMHRYEGASTNIGADTLLLLLPDSVEESTPAVREWIEAASEEGLHLEPIHDSDFLAPLSTVHAMGVIIPDQLHRMANDVLVGELYRYVRAGGNVMVVYDACTWDLNGRFPPGDSRLSELVGVHYALYDRFTTTTMEPAQVTGTAEAMKALEIPPGSFVPLENSGRLGLWHQVAQRDTTDRFAFATYLYGAVDYPVFRTVGDYDGEVLLKSKPGLGAGFRKEGLGQVLFVNLPLGYLASRTDGLLLHSFLHYFSLHVIGMPYLASVPDGVGGLIFNWHIDNKLSLAPLKTLADAGVFDRGKFSVDITAGPDVDAFGDHKGLDVEHDPEAQKWIRYLASHGQEIGSHGGWIHNYFGYHLNDQNENDFQKYLEMNKDALERVSGKHIVEYSAPVGNHPAWVTRWLERHGFQAYYFTGDAGLGPTRVFRDEREDAPDIWAFPILHMGKEASLEEMGFEDVPLKAVREWLFAVTDFTVRNHTARLVYTHPYGAEKFFGTLRAWLDNSDALERQGHFRWYTMPQLAQFLNDRESVHWNLLRGTGGSIVLRASHPNSLAHYTWVFPQNLYQGARVLEGNADIRIEDNMIFVDAKEGRELTVEMNRATPHPKTQAIEAKR